jgi:hypothetical protein
MSRADDHNDGDLPPRSALHYRVIDAGRRRRPPTLLAVLSFIGALAAFPVGAAISIVLTGMPRLVSRSFADRAGFMLFAAGAGAACATGCLAFSRARNSSSGAGRAAMWFAFMGILLGAIGSVGAVTLIIYGTIR